MNKQNCGSVNREHNPANIKTETITQTNAFGSKATFERKRCGDCGAFLGDTILPQASSQEVKPTHSSDQSVSGFLDGMYPF